MQDQEKPSIKDISKVFISFILRVYLWTYAALVMVKIAIEESGMSISQEQNMAVIALINFVVTFVVLISVMRKKYSSFTIQIKPLESDQS